MTDRTDGNPLIDSYLHKGMAVVARHVYFIRIVVDDLTQIDTGKILYGFPTI